MDLTGTAAPAAARQRVADWWPHPLTAEGRALIPVPPGSTVRDVVRLARPTGPVEVVLDGRLLPPEEWDRPIDGAISVRAVAAGGDSDARTILQLAVLAASVAVGNIAALGPVWGALAAAGVNIVGNLLVNALFPPEVPGADKPPPPLYSLTGGANRARPYGPILLTLGRHRVFPDLAGREYVERRGDTEMLFQLFDFGVAGTVEDVRIGDTPIDDFDEVSAEWLRPGEFPLLVEASVETLPGAEIGDQELQPRPPSANGLQVSAAATGWLTRTAPRGTHRVAVDFAAQLMWARAGEIGEMTLGLLIEIQEEAVWTANPAAAAWKSSGWFQISNASAEALRVTREFDGLDPAKDWQVRIARDRGIGAEIDQTRKNEDVIRNTCSVTGLRCYRRVAAAPATTRLALRIRASGQLNGRIDRLSAMVSSVGRAPPTWEQAAAPTDNPASLFVAYARGWEAAGQLVAGMGLDADALDLPGLADWHAWCARQRLGCNALLDGGESHAEALRLIARCGRASPTWQSGRLGVVWEDEARPSTALITPGNTIAGSFRVDWAPPGTAEEVATRFVDPAADWQFSVVRATVPGTVGRPRETAEVTLRGVTDRQQAQRECNRLAAAQRHHRRTCGWRMGREGSAIVRGDVVDVANDLISGGLAGRVAGGTADEPWLDRDPGAAGWLDVRLRSGHVHRSRFARLRSGQLSAANSADLWAVALEEPLEAAPDAVGAEPRDLLWRALADGGEAVRLRIVDARPHRNGEIEFSTIDEVAAYHAADTAAGTVLVAGAGDPRFPRVVGLKLQDAPPLTAGGRFAISAVVEVSGLDWTGIRVWEQVAGQQRREGGGQRRHDSAVGDRRAGRPNRRRARRARAGRRVGDRGIPSGRGPAPLAAQPPRHRLSGRIRRRVRTARRRTPGLDVIGLPYPLDPSPPLGGRGGELAIRGVASPSAALAPGRADELDPGDCAAGGRRQPQSDGADARGRRTRRLLHDFDRRGAVDLLSRGENGAARHAVPRLWRRQRQRELDLVRRRRSAAA